MTNRTETTMPLPRRREGSCGIRRLLVAVLVPSFLSACEFEVTNPGPTQDTFLDRPSSRPALVDGAHRLFNDAWNEMARVMGSATRDIFPSGNTGSFGISPNERQGIFLIEDQNDKWNLIQNARFAAEDALRRFRQQRDAGTFPEFDASPIVAEAYLWAGYSNRMFGENFCEVVLTETTAIEPAGPEPATAALRRAEEQFTQAIQIASAAEAQELELAALGARASVRLDLGELGGARADAEALLAADPSFNFQTAFSGDETNQYNSLFWSSANEPYKVHSVWNTFYDDYFATTEDPRVPWTAVEGFPEGSFAVGPLGLVPFHQQLKHAERASPSDLTDAREMWMIIAEVELENGNWPAAMTIINDLRADVGMDPWVAGSEGEAWTFLMREWGIETWLEARRAAQRRRWAADPVEDPWVLRSDISSAGGQLSVYEVPSECTGGPDGTCRAAPEHERGWGNYLHPEQSTVCFPIPLNERERNPNIPIP